MHWFFCLNKLVLELFENYTSELKFANDFIIRFPIACFECGHNKKDQSKKLLLGTCNIQICVAFRSPMPVANATNCFPECKLMIGLDWIAFENFSNTICFMR